MSNAEYHVLLRLPAGAVREGLVKPAGGETDRALDALLAPIADEALRDLVADVGGHDLGAVLDAFGEAERRRDRPCVILADTIKGWRLPLAGDPMNHGALLSATQLAELGTALGIAPARSGRASRPARPRPS